MFLLGPSPPEIAEAESASSLDLVLWLQQTHIKLPDCFAR